ncbi:MAG: hypothetical protein DYG85_08700, partial [Chloroflexi bacterium CFX1]|nr:hypothetical protein [Chloroflexi bacterium CFX1]
RPTDQPTNKPSDQQTKRPTNQPTNRPTDHQTRRPTWLDFTSKNFPSGKP